MIIDFHDEETLKVWQASFLVACHTRFRKWRGASCVEICDYH
jgi:hypothetical protein